MKKSNKITMSQVAQETGFSIATVSHVVNKTRYVDQDTKKIILDAMDRLNYTSKMSGLPKNSKLIGMIIADIREDFYVELIKSVEVSAMENGYSLILCDAEGDIEREKVHLDNLLDRNVSGIIISPMDQYHIPIALDDIDIPAICIDRRYKESSFDSITINNFEAGRKLTENLISKTTGSIGFIGYGSSIYTVVERAKGYMNAMESNQLDSNILEIAYYQNKILQDDIINFITEGRLALVCATSHICFEVVNALKEIYGNIPDDFYIGTFDENKWFRYIEPKLTIIKQPTVEMGFIAVELLVNRINYPLSALKKTQYRKNIVLDFEIIQI